MEDGEGRECAPAGVQGLYSTWEYAKSLPEWASSQTAGVPRVLARGHHHQMGYPPTSLCRME